ncbi:MAG: hypothetical protein ACFFAH_04940 [Promethearchaeota archaeon]
MSKIFQNESVNIGILLLFSLILFLIRPLFYTNVMSDIDHYVKIIYFFRGEGDLMQVNYSFRSRILVPLLASILPFNAYIALTIVTIIFTMFSVLLFNRFLTQFDLNKKQQYLGTIIFILAEPTFVDGTIGGTDSAQIFFVLLVLYLYFSLDNSLKKSLIISIIIGVGILARESVIFIAPVILIWRLIDVRFKIDWREFRSELLLILGIPLISYILLKIFIPSRVFYGVHLSIFYRNLSLLSNPSLLVTVAQLLFLLLTGIFGNYSNIMKKSPIIWKLIIGMITYFIFNVIYIFFSAAFCSRFLWILFIFIIPFFLLSLNEFNKGLDRIEQKE